MAPLTTTGLETLRVQTKVPALAAAAATRDEPPQRWAVGERKRGSGVAVTVNDQWHLGSITKSMTATLVARMVDAGKVGWDDTIWDTLGATAPRMQAIYRPATFRHLLTHHASLPHELPLAKWRGFSVDFDKGYQERSSFVRKALEKLEPVAPLGERFRYSNIGYVVAAAMLEARLGRSWESLVAEQVFQPLGLSSAGIGPNPPSRSRMIDQPVGHRVGLYRVAALVARLTGAEAPAGGVYMGLDDLLTFLAAHRDRTDLLKPETWRVLHAPGFGSNYAMGWEAQPNGVLTHSGSTKAWIASTLIDPSRGIAAAAAANQFDDRTIFAVGLALNGAISAVAV